MELFLAVEIVHLNHLENLFQWSSAKPIEIETIKHVCFETRVFLRLARQQWEQKDIGNLEPLELGLREALLKDGLYVTKPWDPSMAPRQAWWDGRDERRPVKGSKGSVKI